MFEPDQEHPQPPRIKLESLGQTPTRVFVVIGFVGVLLLIATLKPWSGPPPSGPTPAVAALVENSFPAAAAGSVPAATPDELAAARSRMLCGSDSQWRLLTMETGTLGTSRTVYSQVPTPAAGPQDSSIPTVNVAADRLLGIGVCRPEDPAAQEDPTPVSGVSIWEAPAPGAPAQAADVATIDADLSRVGEAYFRPATTDPIQPPDADADWAPGRYVVEIEATNGQDEPLWVALDFTNIQASTGAVGQ